jgi:predicted AlkP superfamily phosphohydrolase/phosphomutase
VDRFVADLTAMLHELVEPSSGAPLVREVLRTADLFPGERSDHLPDLLVRWHRDRPIGGAASPRIGRLVREDNGRRSGDHRPEGMFFARRAGLDARSLDAPVAIEDFAPTIAALLGAALADVDGKLIGAVADGG